MQHVWSRVWVLALLAACATATSQSPTVTTQAGPGLATGPAATGPAATSAGTTPARPAPSGPPRLITEVEGITEYALDNGLRVLLFPDPSAEKVTVNITYFVGSRHEGYGESGMAHLLEHMVFKGTPKHPDIWNLLKNRGADFNGTTWYDRTNYYETLPASDDNLEFALALEADRMINSKISADDLKSEFSVVRNEFEMGENSPFSTLMDQVANTAFLWHNYGKTTIGNQSDIERVPVKNLRRFYEKYYQPDNAMLVVAGKFDKDKALALVHKHYGAIPKPARELDPTYTVEPVQEGERHINLRRVGDIGMVAVHYHGVPSAHADATAFEGAIHVLTDEPSGRLYKALVQTGLASNVIGMTFPTKEPGSVFFFAEVPKGKPLEPVRDKMLAVLEGLGGQTLTNDEVSRFINRTKKELALAMADSERIAIELTEYAAVGDWRLLFVMRDRVEKVTPADIQRVAKSYFKRDNRTTGFFIPTASPDRSPLPEQPDVLAMVKDYKGKGLIAEGEAFAANLDTIEARTRRSTLASGAKLALLAKETRGDVVKARITLHFGTERDLKGKITAANFTPDMLLRGTKKRTYQQILDELDRLQAKVAVGGGGLLSSNPGSTTVMIETVRQNLPAVLALVAEILKEPSFPQDQFDILKKERIAELESQLSDPMARGFSMMTRMVAPYAKDDVRYVPTMEEELAQLKALRLEDVKSFHRSFFGASHAEMTMVGDFDAEATAKDIATHFGTWKSPKPYQRIDYKYSQTRGSDEVVVTPDKRMAMIVGAHQVKLRDDHPDFPAVEILAYIMAGNPSSRLLTRLRHKEGLSYGAFGGIAASTLDDRGILWFGAMLAPQNVDKAMQLTMEEMEKLKTDGVTAAELEEAKKSYLEEQTAQLANDDYVASRLNSDLYFGRTLAWQKTLNDKIKALTPEDIKRVANAYMHVDQLVKIKAGDLRAPGKPAPATKSPGPKQ